MDQTVNGRTYPHLWTAGKLFLFLLIVAGLVLLARNAPIDQTIAWLTAEVEALGIWGPLAFGGLFVLFTVFFLPATPVVLASGAVFGTLFATALISAASTLSAALSFLGSRYVAHERVAARIRRYPKLGAVYRALAGPDGWKVVVAVRLSHAMPFGVQNLLFGASPVRFVPFLAATWAAMLPGTILYAYLGHLGAAALQEGAGTEPAAGVESWALRVGGLIVALLAVLYVGQLGRRIVREKAHVDLGANEPAGPS